MSDLPKRFYKEAGVLEDGGGFGIALDQRSLKTPAGTEFRVPTRTLGKAVALEWGAQAERINVAAMPLTQLSYVAIDETPNRRGERAHHIAKYGETDLVCHRAETPAALAKRQAAAWDELISWAQAEFGLTLPIVTGVIAADVPAEMLEKLRAHAMSLDNFRLTALNQAAALAGSAIIGLALAHGRIDGETAFRAATVDEEWSMESWGEDAEARARLDRLRTDFESLGRFVAALS